MEIELNNLQNHINRYLNSSKFKNSNEARVQHRLSTGGTIALKDVDNIVLTFGNEYTGQGTSKVMRLRKRWSQTEINGWITGFKTWALKWLTDHFGDGTKFEQFTARSILSHHQTNTSKVGKTIYSCIVEFTFNPEALRRDSLMPEVYPEGVDNIFKLFAHGYNFTYKTNGSVISKRVHGIWRHNLTYALAVREPDYVLNTLVEEYNIIHALEGIHAEVGTIYND